MLTEEQFFDQMRRVWSQFGVQAPRDPLAMLRDVRAVNDVLRDRAERDVAEARREGATWQEIADALGTARQNAWRKYHHVDH